MPRQPVIVTQVFLYILLIVIKSWLWIHTSYVSVPSLLCPWAQALTMVSNQT